MELIIKGRNIEISDYLRQYVHKKIGKLDRYLPDITEARVELATENTRSAGEMQVAQVTVRVNGTILRGEERSPDMFASIDAVLDKMYRQIARYKGKRQDRWRGRGERLPIPSEELEEEAEREIVRRKRFRMFPMTEEEAIEQMELLGHDFFVFYNANSGEVNVLYRRKDGDYGLIEPELV
ncbi:MAG: ribosome hibernation-promoting factor, HPF/YfiA family [Anaerolineae bacterium]